MGSAAATTPLEVAPTDSRTADVARWLKIVLAKSKPHRVDLCKVPQIEPVMSWACEGQEPGALEELAREMVDMAEVHGRGFNAAPGAAGVNYRLRALTANAVQLSETLFCVPGAPKGGGVEVSDVHQAFATVCKMYVDLGSVLIRAFAGRDQAWEKQNELLLEQNQELRRSHYGVLQQQQRQMFFEVERERAAKSLEREERKDEWLQETLSALVPVAANRLAGGGPGKGAPAAEAMLSAICSRFTDDQIEYLIGPGSPLDEGTKLMFGELYKSVIRRKLTMLNEKVTAANAGNHNNHNGVAGGGPGESAS